MNGKLVSPTHTLANAEVVEIVTYDVRAEPPLLLFSCKFTDFNMIEFWLMMCTGCFYEESVSVT